MLEVGKRYDITMLEAGSKRTKSYGWLVTKSAPPLVEVSNGEETKIINTGSTAFVSAELSKNQSGERPVVEIMDFSKWADAAGD